MQEMQERIGEWCVVCVCVSYSPPPCIYSREPWGEASTTDVGDQWGCAVPWLRQWGPQARSANQVGRSACPGRQPPPTSWSGLVLVSPCPKVEARPAPAGFASVLGLHLVHLSLNRYSDIFCDFVSGQSVLVTCILA